MIRSHDPFLNVFSILDIQMRYNPLPLQQALVRSPSIFKSPANSTWSCTQHQYFDLYPAPPTVPGRLVPGTRVQI